MLNQEALEKLVTPTIEHLGFSLWAALPVAQGKRWVIQLLCDGPQGFSIQNCQQVSRQVQGVLEVSRVFEEPYVLEVSSPGFERPLIKIRHFESYLDFFIIVKLKPHSILLDSKQKVLLKKVDPVQQSVQVLCEDGLEVTIPLSDIQTAHLALDHKH